MKFLYHRKELGSHKNVLQAKDKGLAQSISSSILNEWASLVAQLVKNPLAMQKMWVWSLSQEDPLKKGMATHYSILVWRISDWGVWWAAVYRITKSWTWLKQLSTLTLEWISERVIIKLLCRAQTLQSHLVQLWRAAGSRAPHGIGWDCGWVCIALIFSHCLSCFPPLCP